MGTHAGLVREYNLGEVMCELGLEGCIEASMNHGARGRVGTEGGWVCRSRQRQ